MSSLVRKIGRSRWPETPPASPEELSADSVTGGCLRTTENELSVWRIEPDDWEEAVLAICCNQKFESLDTIDLVWLDEGELTGRMILLNESEGDTAVQALKHKHADIVGLTYASIGVLAFHVASRICDKRFCRRVLRSEVKRILSGAIEAGKLNASDLSAKLQEKLRCDSRSAA